MPNQSEPLRADDVVAFMVDDRYCVDIATFTNNSGSTATFEVGQVLTGVNPTAVGAATADGILLDRVVSIANAASVSVRVLKRGPAIVNQSRLNFSGATAGNLTGKQAALLALGIKQAVEPVSQTVQTT